MIGILSTLSEFELSRIKERSKEGIAEAKKRGAYANNGGNKRIESIEEFMNKESSKKVVKQLKKGFSVRDCAGICGCSVSLVMKVKKLVEDSESTSKKVLISEPTKKTIETTTKETKAKKKKLLCKYMLKEKQ
jgi:DNA invertase Pin-like site-specific DNA recombinase